MTDTDMLYMASLEKRNAELETRVAELEEKHLNECRQIAHYSDENAKLKELLKEATSDIKAILREDFGEICVFCKWFDKEDFECAKPNNGSGSLCCECAGWRREGEALALIGEDTNVPAREDGAENG